jgi:hypothetical protein
MKRLCKRIAHEDVCAIFISFFNNLNISKNKESIYPHNPNTTPEYKGISFWRQLLYTPIARTRFIIFWIGIAENI